MSNASAKRNESTVDRLRTTVEQNLRTRNVVILPPMDVFASVGLLKALEIRANVSMLDPWYNKGFGGIRPDYVEFIVRLLKESAELSDHVYLWGFPEIVARFVERIPDPLKLVAWLTWYYKNNPSVIRGWRSSQNACLHLSHPGARLYPEHFLNEAQQGKLDEGKLRYMPGPTSVIESPLLVGFVGRKEQTGHPSQKPAFVFERLIQMVTDETGLVFDPMCGSGTTGEVCVAIKRRAIISDHSEEYIRVCEKRLGLSRIEISSELIESL